MEKQYLFILSENYDFKEKLKNAGISVSDDYLLMLEQNSVEEKSIIDNLKEIWRHKLKELSE